MKTVQDGLWGLWCSVAQSEMVQTAAKTVADTASSTVQAVSEKGLVGATRDADERFLSGALSNIVSTTKDVAKSGISAVTTNLPFALESNVGSQYSFTLASATLPKV